jgi:hypothetical protein
MFIGFVILVGGHQLGWDEGRLARDSLMAVVSILMLAGALLVPLGRNQPAWPRLTVVLAWAWLMYKAFGHYISGT